MDSRFEGNRALDAPQLNFVYRARDFYKMRELGATWKMITENMPQPKGIAPNGDSLTPKSQ